MSNILNPIEVYNSKTDQRDMVLKHVNKHFRKWFDDGVKMRNERKYAGSIFQFTKMIQTVPSNHTGWNSRGCTFMEMGEIRKAFEDFKKAYEINKNDRCVKNNLIKCYLELKKKYVKNKKNI